MKFVLPVILCAVLAFTVGPKRMDLIFLNARVIDGTGNSWIKADVGIRKGKVAVIGNLKGARAKRIIDVEGQVVAPGFIDVHAHVERSILQRPTAENFLHDGVTSIITGNCGGSETDLKTFFKALEKEGLSINVGSLIGHNSVRREVMGEENRTPTSKELEAMKSLVAAAMEDGAVGLSTGLIYTPGTYSETAEVVALAEVAARFNGVYASHIRNEDHRVFDAIDEAVYIGKTAELPVEISHFKITGKANWGRSPDLIKKIRDYREEGVDVTVDQYPYTASSTRLGVLLPSWSLAGGRDALNQRLEDAPERKKIIEEMKGLVADMGFEDYRWAYVASCPWKPEYNGKNLSEINRQRGGAATLDGEIETILALMSKKERIQMVYHKMSEEDVGRIMQFPMAMVASDAGIPEFGTNYPHPRAYGTNARVLGHYVREKGILTLEEAVRKMTSLPAQRFGLENRGLLRPGYAADIVVFDPDQIGDLATFEAPHAYSKGISFVIINGVPVIENAVHNKQRPGEVLRKKY